MQSNATPSARRKIFSGTPARLRGMALAALCAVFAHAFAGETYILDEPLATRPNVKAKPNLLFVLDDSGSMAWDFMPDDMSNTGTYGYRSAQCNGVAYDPTITYALPLDAAGQPLPAPSFTAAWRDGFARTGDTINLDQESIASFTTKSAVTPGTGSKTFSISSNSSLSSNTFTAGQVLTLTDGGSRSMAGTVTSWAWSNKNGGTLDFAVTSASGTGSATSWTAVSYPSYYYTYNTTSGSQPKMGWTFTSSGVVQNTFYRECMSDVGATPGSGVFNARVTVRSSSAEAQNYANWYSYYRTRSLLMRTAVGRAFKTLDDSYRVGFSTINSSKDVTTSAGFHPIDDFGTTQKTDVYSKLYSAGASGNTPLRGALSKAGRYYAKNYPDQTDPVQYSCQRNYTLLSTDGYWNTGAETSSYGPLDLNQRTVGNQDGTEVRPMYDGTTATTTTTIRTYYTVGNSGSCTRNNGRSGFTVTAQPQQFDSGVWTNQGRASNDCVAGSTAVVNGKSASTLAGKSEAGPESTNTEVTGGAADTLADIAEYYYKTDLRTDELGNCTSTASGTSQNVCSNILKPSGRDTAPHQHMTTFTIGLGLSGTLAYDRNYLTQPTGAYVDLTSGPTNWPAPAVGDNAGDARNIDDLWHAAVNGRGQYYSALNATELGEAISGVVNTIMEDTGSSSAASTSALELVSGDKNQVFKASYTTKTWVGDVQAYSLNGDDGTIGTAYQWSAQTKLTSGMAAADRKIYYRQPTATTTLRAFNWDNLNADGYGDSFTNLCSKTLIAAQCAHFSATEKTAAEAGAKLVDYLRGVRTYEAANTTGSTADKTTRALFRPRAGVLGDIINGAPVYVSKPPFSYSDPGYADFVAARKSRTPMVYAAANDGMLHAFSAASGTGGGVELWAYVPSWVMPDIYRLADTSYESRHRYFVDGAPVVGDIKVGTTWKTIVVGGLGKGGRSYYALDVTDPENPKALWEFTNTNLGLTFGNPMITKRKDGTWVVAFSSGYNNHVSGGDGKGHLFVVNANTGALALDIPTTAGSTSDPSGLSKINAWIDDPSDNTAKRFYGGDLQGNLWRFDVDELVEPHQGALALAKFQINASTPQPVTIAPETVLVGGKPGVVVATGRYLGTADIEDTTQQSIYAIKDSLTSTGVGDVRTSDKTVRQTFTATGNEASISSNPVDWGTQDGWWVDLPHSGERVVGDLALQFGTISIGTAIPNGDACSSGGKSWRYYLNASNGHALDDPAGQMWNANALIVGQSWVKLENGQTRILRQNSDGTIQVEKPPGGGGSAGMPHRNSWRELAD